MTTKNYQKKHKQMNLTLTKSFHAELQTEMLKEGFGKRELHAYCLQLIKEGIKKRKKK